MPYTIGSVPYVNAYPLVHALENPSSGVEVRYAVPSSLPPLLDSGEADAILVSIVDAFRYPDRRIADGVCIGSFGPVKSVRLFSQVPFGEIQTLALDASSMTSNALAQIVLAEVYGAHPSLQTHAPDLADMLKVADACVLIGDIGMLTDGSGLHVLDLGEAWTGMTGLPFVWAAWIGQDRLTPELVGILQRAATTYPVGQGSVPDATLDLLVRDTVERSGWTEAMVRDYFGAVMVYRLDEAAWSAIETFRHHLLAQGHPWPTHSPTLVRAG